jgi:hypothetical protein
VPLKNPVIFTILVLAALFAAGIVTYIYGLPLLQNLRNAMLVSDHLVVLAHSDSSWSGL